MPVMNKNCLFHTDRVQFDLLEKEIKRSKWIPRDYCHRLASAICSCRKHLDWRPNEEELSDHIQYFRAVLDSEEHKISSFLHGLMKNILETVTSTDYCRCRLLQILFLAKHDIFLLLTRSAIRENSTITLSVDEVKYQHECILQEKKNQKVLEIADNLFKNSANKASFQGELFSPSAPDGHVPLTPKYETISHPQKDKFSFSINNFARHKSFDNNINKSHIEIRRRNPHGVRSLRTLLKQRTRERQQQQQTYCGIEIDSRKKKVRKEDKDNEINSPVPSSVFDIEIKDRLADDFGLKVLKHDSYKKSEKKSVLDGGHCYNCLQTFESLKNPDTCKHHPGFVLYDRWWSCCWEPVENPRDLANEHAISGCEEGHHAWRIHKSKKAFRKPKKNLLQRNPVLNIHLKEYERRK